MLLGLILSATIAATSVEAYVSLSAPQSSSLRTSKFSGSAIETGPIFAQNSRLNLRNAGRNRPSHLNTFMSASLKGGLSLEYITADSTKIAYDFIPGNKPTVVYLPSFNQTRFGSKASALQTWCKRNKQALMFCFHSQFFRNLQRICLILASSLQFDWVLASFWLSLEPGRLAQRSFCNSFALSFDSRISKYCLT